MNTIGRKTERRKVALRHMENNDFKTPYFNRDREITTLKERIASAPTGKVSTKKHRNKDTKSSTNA